MKYLCVLLFSLAVLGTSAQKKTNVLLAGTIHYIPDSLQQNWKNFKTFLENYKPDAIFVEFRMPDDSVSLIHAEGERYRIINDSLEKAWNITIADKEARIKELYIELNQTEDWKKRIELYQLLYIKADFANAAFQAWRAYMLIAAMPQAEIEKIRSAFAVYKRIEFFISRIKNNEYFNIVFPLAVQFNISYLYPVDDWTYNRKFSLAFQQGYEEMKGTAYENKWKASWEEFNKIEAGEIKNGDGLLFVNTPAWQKKADYVQALLYEEAGNRSYSDYVMYWHLRNKKVSGNILNAIESKKHRRVLVFMGYLHIPDIKKNLKDDKKVVIKNF